MTELHPDVAALSFLLGTWRGEGTGAYPTIDAFTYEEETRFWHVGKPFLGYAQRTQGPDGEPRHSESGYWRPVGPGRVELVLAHPTGIVEVAEGSVSGGTIALASTTVARTASAKEVASLERVFEVDGDVMTYELRMAAVGHPMTHHLRATLRRVAD